MSISWSSVGPPADLNDLLEVGVATTHFLHCLAGPLAQHDGHDVEEDQHCRLIEAAHWQDARPSFVIGHGLGAQMDHCVSRGGNLTFRLRSHRHWSSTGRMSHSYERFHSRERAWTGADHEQVAGTERRGGHVADH